MLRGESAVQAFGVQLDGTPEGSYGGSAAGGRPAFRRTGRGSRPDLGVCPTKTLYAGSMSFWRDKVIQPALDAETRAQMDEQREWIARNPKNPRPYYHLAQFYRIEGRQEEAMGLLLEAVRLDETLAAAQVSLA